jgi:predicted RNase H-like HicB family nuclease
MPRYSAARTFRDEVLPVPQDFNVVIERDADGMLVASVPALPGCYTQAPTHDELMDRIKEAIALHLEDQN